MPVYPAPFSTQSWMAANSIHDPSLTPWFAALANRQFARCNVVCLGDSITEGQHAVGPPGTGFENRWLARLRDMLRQAFPTPGTLGTGGGRGYIGSVGTGETSFTWPTTITGTPGAVGFSPKGAGQQLNATGQAISFPLTGDSADIMWAQTAGGGTFNWQVDGGATTNIVTNGGSSVDGKISHISLGTAGAHTLALNWVSGNSDVDGVVEYNGDFASGIQVHDAGHFGWTTANWLTAITGGANSATAAIAALNPALVIITLGVNDQFNNVVPATFAANIQTIITNLKAQLTSPYPAFVVHMLPPRSNQGTYTYAWPLYVQQCWGIASADTSGPAGVNGLATSIVQVMDYTQGPRIAGSDQDVYGIWQSADLVHPSNKGHQMIADYMTWFLQQ
jgi:lysophospholipase L1-like esterase